jgi:ribosomal protein S18 acetylase RimI-like enzyme
MRKPVVVRRLGIADAEDYRAIRLSALKTAPEAFGSVHALEAPRPIEMHAERLTSSLVLGAYDNETIVGMIGFKQEGGPKDAHKGFLWGFYVEPESRKQGVGAALVAAVLQAARAVVEQVTLTVVEENSAAIALYERFGFMRYGLEPRALKTEAGYSNEVLMVLFLNGPAPPEFLAPLPA